MYKACFYTLKFLHVVFSSKFQTYRCSLLHKNSKRVQYGPAACLFNFKSGIFLDYFEVTPLLITTLTAMIALITL